MTTGPAPPAWGRPWPARCIAVSLAARGPPALTTSFVSTFLEPGPGRGPRRVPLSTVTGGHVTVTESFKPRPLLSQCQWGPGPPDHFSTQAASGPAAAV